jgi:NADH-quinone oxidoreductase subunit L
LAWTQNDIKRVIAYSTCSQLGYMFFAAGVGRLWRGDVPPVHPRLLQGAAVPRRGSVIHAMHHEQDMRYYGGLRKRS